MLSRTWASTTRSSKHANGPHQPLGTMKSSRNGFGCDDAICYTRLNNLKSPPTRLTFRRTNRDALSRAVVRRLDCTLQKPILLTRSIEIYSSKSGRRESKSTISPLPLTQVLHIHTPTMLDHSNQILLRTMSRIFARLAPREQGLVARADSP